MAASLDSVIQQQLAYYRARAGEYDEWFYRIGPRYDLGEAGIKAWFAEVESVFGKLHALGPVDDVLELACGTGNFTKELAKIAKSVEAIDASPETIEINRTKITSGNVSYTIADLFTWKPERQYDLVFAGFWLSHVPPELLDSFLATVSTAIKPGGRLMMVDSLREAGKASANDETSNDFSNHYHVRTLNSGEQHTIVKVFYGKELVELLRKHGMEAEWNSGTHFWYSIATKV